MSGTALTGAEHAAITAIEADRQAMTDQVIAWSRINSGSAHLRGLARMADALAEAFGALPGRIARHDAAPVEAIDARGETSSLARGQNLLLTVRPEAPVQVLLAGHMDTVFPEADAFQTPAWREPGVLNGPGVADMKGGLSVMLRALLALESSPHAHRLGYQVVINSDEEVSSLGSAALLAEAASRAQLGLVYEPAASPDGTLAGARKGLAAFTLVARGVSAHAGRNPEAGRNAILAAADFALQAAALSGQREGLSLNVARIEGGGPTNVVPDLALCRFEARCWTHEDRHWVEHRLAQLAGLVGLAHGVELALHGRFTRPPKPLDAHTLGLFEAVRRCGADLGQSLGWTATGGCCDGNNLAQTGLAVVDTLGVRGGAIHSRDEYMIAESLTERAQLSALLLMRLASGAIPVPGRGEARS